MSVKDMVTLRNKKTGEIVTVPRSKYETGFSGIGSDVAASLASAPEALGNMLDSIPGGVANVASYAVKNNPASTLGNIGAGGVESLAGLLSSPHILMRYLSDKFPDMAKRMQGNGRILKGVSFNEPTFYEGLKGFEKAHGLEAQTPEEESVRNAGGLLFGGKVLTSLPNMLSRASAMAAENAGRGGDPVHAAILGVLGEKTAQMLGKGINKAAAVEPATAAPFNPETPLLNANMAPMLSNPNGYMTAINNIPQAAINMTKAAKNAVEKIPEKAMQNTASGLEALADYGSGIPMAAPVLQPTLGALASYLKHKSIAPEDLARQKLFGDITQEDLPIIQQRMEAAKRLGLSFLTPGEAMLSPFQTAKEANIGRTSPGAKLLYSKGKERFGTEARAIDSLLDSIYDEKSLGAEKQKAYKESMDSTVPNEFMEKWKQNPIVDYAIKQMDTKPTYKSALQNVPKNSFEYWDIVKRIIGDLEGEELQGMKKYSSNAATDIRNRMVDEMDAINPRYETARNIAERKFTRKELEDVFDKKKMTFNNFYSFLKSEKKFNKIMGKLSPFPEAQQKLKDIRLLSNELIPFDESIRTAHKLERTGMTKERNKLDALKRDLDERYGGEHDVAAVNLMTHPDLLKLIQAHLKKKGK